MSNHLRLIGRVIRWYTPFPLIVSDFCVLPMSTVNSLYYFTTFNKFLL